MMKIDLLVGVHQDEDLRGRFYPIVAGAIDHTVLEVISLEEENEMWMTMRKRFSPAHDEYHWRQVEVDLDDRAVAKHFQAPAVVAAVSDPKDS